MSGSQNGASSHRNMLLDSLYSRRDPSSGGFTCLWGMLVSALLTEFGSFGSFVVSPFSFFPSFLFSKFLVFIRNLRKMWHRFRGVCTESVRPSVCLSLRRSDRSRLQPPSSPKLAVFFWLLNVLHSQKKKFLPRAQKASEIPQSHFELVQLWSVFETFVFRNDEDSQEGGGGEQRGENVTFEGRSRIKKCGRRITRALMVNSCEPSAETFLLYNKSLLPGRDGKSKTICTRLITRETPPWRYIS